MALQTCILYACYPTHLLCWLYVYMLMGLWLIALNKISVSVIKFPPYGVMLILFLFLYFNAFKTDTKLTLHHMRKFFYYLTYQAYNLKSGLHF